MPAVSVVMPVYNARRYVAQAVSSILAQTFADFELIVVDDGSTDGSAQIVQATAAGDQRLRLISQPNRGVSNASNRGTELARAQYLARMDADDVALPQRLARQAQYMEEHPDCVLLGSRVMFIDADGDPLYEMPGLKFTHEEIDAGLMNAEWTIHQPACMMRLDAVRNVGGYREDLKIHEDYDLFLKLAEVGRVANLAEVLLLYRRHAHSAVNTHSKLHVESMRQVLESARKRRGIGEAQPLPQILPEQADTKRELKRQRLWAWMSLKAGHRRTARKYAMRGLLCAPCAVESWKLAYCAWRGH